MLEVAKFWKPTGAGGKGQYELKAECYKEYNPFFYHYIRSEQSKVHRTHIVHMNSQTYTQIYMYRIYIST